MDAARAVPAPADRPVTDASPAQRAKAALRTLAADKLEPTPENYAIAYRRVAGKDAPATVLPAPALALLEQLTAGTSLNAASQQELMNAFSAGGWQQAAGIVAQLAGGDTAATQAAALANLIERVVLGLDRGGRQWTSGRKKSSLMRVLAGSRTDAQRLQQRVSQLLSSWETDTDGTAADPDAVLSSPATGVDPDASEPASSTANACRDIAQETTLAAPRAWPSTVQALGDSVLKALPANDLRYAGLLQSLSELIDEICSGNPTPTQVETLAQLCERAEWVLQNRNDTFEQLGDLCFELTASLGDLAEDDSWVKGQLAAMRLKLEDGLSSRGVRSVSDLLRHTRERQHSLRDERTRSHRALKDLINHMLQDLGELGKQTGGFHESIGRYADVIARADSIESITGVVREMVEEAHAVRTLVGQTQQRLQSEHAHATNLSIRVTELESELRRLSDEVSTDQLTQIANRRGLLESFEAERARMQRSGQTLAVGLLDIDNFKRLNDELGHSAGDQALKSLSTATSEALRPTDLVARYGGEEFVVLLPATSVEEGEEILTRLQRSLSAGLFMHNEKKVLVTFSAGVTAYQEGESLEKALERADEALYVAKRTGKNRTCIC